MKRFFTTVAIILAASGLFAQQHSVAGFFPLEDSGRQIYNFNPCVAHG